MGTDKAMLAIGGRTLLDRSVATLALVCDEVVVVTRADQSLPDLPSSARVVVDRVADAGPLAGIEAALQACGSELLVVVPVDMPLVGTDLLRLLVDAARADPGADAVVLRFTRGSAPFPAVLRPRARIVARELLDAGERRVTALFGRLRVGSIPEAGWRPLDPFGRWGVNLNAPGDLAGAALPPAGTSA